MVLDPSVFVHEKALCESDDIGPRTRIWAFVHILPGAVVGADCNLCDYVFIESDARIGDRVVLKPGVQVCDKVEIEDEVFIGPNTVFTNDLTPRVAFRKEYEEWIPTFVRRGASLGASVTLVGGVTVGEHAFVGAGAVIISDVLPHALVVGNPARRIDWVCMCGTRLSPELRCSCGRAYRLSEGGGGLEASS
jgi:UDP-2-acetamido-3-amino-2,3-dideoxy-glucuronate N-acetyltransferase